MANTTHHRWRAVGTPPRLPAFCSGFHAGARRGADRPNPRQQRARVIIGSFARSLRNPAASCRNTHAILMLNYFYGFELE
jgi:hypothetical protein